LEPYSAILIWVRIRDAVHLQPAPINLIVQNNTNEFDGITI